MAVSNIESILNIIVCPKCHSSLDWKKEEKILNCTNNECRLSYPIVDGIPVLLIEEAKQIASA